VELVACTNLASLSICPVRVQVTSTTSLVSAVAGYLIYLVTSLGRLSSSKKLYDSIPAIGCAS